MIKTIQKIIYTFVVSPNSTINWIFLNLGDQTLYPDNMYLINPIKTDMVH